MSFDDVDIVRLIFGTPHGIFAQKFESYERRDGQIDLAHGIDWAVRTGGHLIAEGPTGCGKSLAYLVPAVAHRRRTIVATANISLQEQLIKKDIPMLLGALELERYPYVLLKGRNNYLCRVKAERFFEKHEGDPQVDPIIGWSQSTETGDKSDLPHACSFWAAISSTSDSCIGTGCRYRWDCWTTKARRGLNDAKLVVTNYHMLLLADISREVLICDEAHELPSVARDVLGWTLRRYSAKSIVRWLEESGGTDKPLAEMIDTEMSLFFQEARRYLGKKSRARIFGPWCDTSNLQRLLTQAAGRLTGFRQKIYGDLSCIIPVDEDGNPLPDPSVENPIDVQMVKGLRHDIGVLKKLEKSATNLVGRLKLVSEGPPEGWTSWMESDDKGLIFEGRPLDVSEVLSGLYNTTSIMLSATMTSDRSFALFREETGTHPETRELIIPSPFDHASLAALVVPATMRRPPKGSEDPEPWYDDLAHHLAQLIDYCHGNTLALFTSNAALDAVANRLRKRGLTIVCQGERANNREVIEELRDGKCSAVLGVTSFWTGVDIPGPALSGLFIDRIKFDPPDDPLASALDDALKAKGRDPFVERAIPMATIRMRQGVGRLIRRATDTGVVMIADRRLTTTRWCAPILRSLPPYRLHGSIDQLRKYLGV